MWVQVPQSLLIMPQFDFYIINTQIFYLLLSYMFVFSILSYYLLGNYERVVKLETIFITSLGAGADHPAMDQKNIIQ